MNSGKDSSKTVEELKKRVEFLENRLKYVRSTLDDIVYGDFMLARKSLEKHKETTEYAILEKVFLSILAQSTSSKTYSYLSIIIESMPFPFFTKDENGKYLLANTLEADMFGLDTVAMIGKHDRDFVKDENELKMITESDKEVLAKEKPVELPNQSFTLPNGNSYIFKTHKVPFINPLTGRPNIMGFSIDVTDSVNMEKLKNILYISRNPFS